ncbi:GAF domain-containing protein [Actinomadura barringtoniae]|uniref:GAF domain-containing protein n=1 Tax=Actinomadura barringtoniae TaxID=1427535 RepID=A0A939T7U1_9ACTN|nr:GAF domain-containing protein [Actinomadura barringtoniae]MBO2452379.1 GAF domain-containing protein [Actinomadura barringtoniae]
MFPPNTGCPGAQGHCARLLASTLTTVTDAAQVDGCGLILVANGAPHAVGGSDPDGRLLERAQVAIGSGPAFRCMISGRAVAIRDLPADYPHGHPELAPSAGRVRAVLSVPVTIGRIVAGSLDLYDLEPHDWPPARLTAGTELAEVIGSVLYLLATTSEPVSSPISGVPR